MADIAVVHPDLSLRGGGEAVSVNIIEALQEQHNLSLFCLEDFSRCDVNDYYGSDLHNIDVKQPSWLANLADDYLPAEFRTFSSSFLYRKINEFEHNFDLIINTSNEYTFKSKSVNYVHFPRFLLNQSFDEELQSGIKKKAFMRISRLISGFSEELLTTSTLLTNSEWTKEVIEKSYGVSATVVNPPTNTSNAEAKLWKEQENGFVTIGRIDKRKNTLQVIGIIERLVESGIDTHIHVIGPTTESGYYKKVEEKASELPYVHLEGKVSRKRLFQLISKHRYGIHGRKYEHYGMAVAEMVAGGSIVFVPDGGGQKEIVGNIPQLIYESETDAYKKISNVLSSPNKQIELRESIGDTIVGGQEFKRNIRNIIQKTL